VAMEDHPPKDLVTMVEQAMAVVVVVSVAVEVVGKSLIFCISFFVFLWF
jgi:hypothetical protein